MSGLDWLPEVACQGYGWHFVGPAVPTREQAQQWCEAELAKHLRTGHPANVLRAWITAGHLIRHPEGDLFDPDLSSGALTGRLTDAGSLSWSSS